MDPSFIWHGKDNDVQTGLKGLQGRHHFIAHPYAASGVSRSCPIV